MGNLTEDAVDLEFARKFRRLYRVAWDDLRRGEMYHGRVIRAPSFRHFVERLGDSSSEATQFFINGLIKEVLSPAAFLGTSAQPCYEDFFAHEEFHATTGAAATNNGMDSETLSDHSSASAAADDHYAAVNAAAHSVGSSSSVSEDFDRMLRNESLEARQRRLWRRARVFMDTFDGVDLGLGWDRQHDRQGDRHTGDRQDYRHTDNRQDYRQQDRDDRRLSSLLDRAAAASGANDVYRRPSEIYNDELDRRAGVTFENHRHSNNIHTADDDNLISMLLRETTPHDERDDNMDARIASQDDEGDVADALQDRRNAVQAYRARLLGEAAASDTAGVRTGMQLHRSTPMDRPPIYGTAVPQYSPLQDDGSSTPPQFSPLRGAGSRTPPPFVPRDNYDGPRSFGAASMISTLPAPRNMHAIQRSREEPRTPREEIDHRESRGQVRRSNRGRRGGAARFLAQHPYPRQPSRLGKSVQ